MDGKKFDQLTRVLAEGRTRRSALKALAGGLTAGVAGVLKTGDALGAKCRKPAVVCRKNADCCSNKCSTPDFTGRKHCECVTPVDCPQPSGSCKAATCTSGICGVSSQCTSGQICTNSGCCTPESLQQTCANTCGVQTNNCGQTVTCDPCCAADGTSCSANDECCGVCIDGQCAEASGLCELCDATDDCQSGLMCCSGFCQECCIDSDCGEFPNECGSYFCGGGQCQTNGVASGTPANDQTAGDCHKNVCNGLGEIVNIVDDGDTGDDGNQCTNNVCSNGVNSYPPKAIGAPCSQNGGSICDGAGNCVECVSANDCHTGSTAVGVCATTVCRTGNICGVDFADEGTFVSQNVPGNCQKTVCDGAGGTTIVADPTNLVLSLSGCFDDHCDGTTAVHTPLAARTPCNAGADLCDGAGACVECLLNSDCDAPLVCVSGSCVTCLNDGQVCTEDADCCSSRCSGVCLTF